MANTEQLVKEKQLCEEECLAVEAGLKLLHDEYYEKLLAAHEALCTKISIRTNHLREARIKLADVRTEEEARPIRDQVEGMKTEQVELHAQRHRAERLLASLRGKG